jgi:hypothetical protein
MDSFKPIFDNSIVIFDNYIKNGNLTELLKNFRNSEIFRFIHNGDKSPDEEAISLAKVINPTLYQKYYEHTINKKVLGYGNYLPNYSSYNQLDSRHIMMSVILFSNINNKENISNVLEIGGGYGGWLHLNYGMQNFEKWYIVDLVHLNILQEWYLSNQNVNKNIYELYSNINYNNLLNKKFDIVIGSHSLSEFSIDVFNEYFENLIKTKSKYFFYAYHKTSPNPNIINTKKEIIEQYFELVINVVSENGKVNNSLYINKLFIL